MKTSFQVNTEVQGKTNMQDGDSEKGNVRYDKQVGGMRISFKWMLGW